VQQSTATAEEDGAAKIAASVDPRVAAIARQRKAALEELRQAKEALEADRRAFEAERAKTQRPSSDKRSKDPIAALVEQGYLPADPELQAKALHALSQSKYAEILGEKAPKELQEARSKWEAEKRVYELQQEVRALRDEQNKRMDDERATKAAQAFKDDVKERLVNLPDTMPHLKRIARRKTDAVVDQVYEVTEKVFAATGEIPDVGDVLKYLQKHYEELFGEDFAAIKQEVLKTADKPDAAQTSATTKTLSNNDGTSTRRQQEPIDHDARSALVVDELKAGVGA
jgi:hypothetical protein